jgi:hypothetical protein
MSQPYISTVVPEGYSRYAIRMGGVLLGALDVPAPCPAWAAARLAGQWLAGEQLPDDIRFRPVQS